MLPAQTESRNRFARHPGCFGLSNIPLFDLGGHDRIGMLESAESGARPQGQDKRWVIGFVSDIFLCCPIRPALYFWCFVLPNDLLFGLRGHGRIGMFERCKKRSTAARVRYDNVGVWWWCVFLRFSLKLWFFAFAASLCGVHICLLFRHTQ